MRLRLLLASIVVASGTLTSVATTAAAPSEGFTVEGNVDGLYPGATTPLELEVTNPNDVAIEVTGIQTTVASVAPASAVGCSRDLISVGQPSAPVVVGGGRSTTVALPLRLDRSAPDSCQEATFALVFSATSVEPGTGSAPEEPPTVGGPSADGEAGATSSLPVTGTEIRTVLMVALTVLAAGLLATRVGKRRKP